MLKGHAVAAVNLVIWRPHAGVRIWTAATVKKKVMWGGHAENKKSKEKGLKTEN